LLNINYNELSNYKILKYDKTTTNFIPIIELNLPLYITDIFYINILIYLFLILLIPIIIIFIYINYKKNIFIYEQKEYSNFTLINIINYLFVFVVLYYAISMILTLSLIHNNNMLLFEFDIQFNIQNYIYKYIYILIIFYIIILFKTINVKYLKYNNI